MDNWVEAAGYWQQCHRQGGRKIRSKRIRLLEKTLENSIFFIFRLTNFHFKSLILLVGATGIEPVTR